MTKEPTVEKSPIVIDVENINELKQQTIKLLEELIFAYDAICDSMILFDPIGEKMDQDADLRSVHGEYFGYNNGMIDSSSGNVEVAIINMQKVIEGSYDELTLSSMTIFVTIWYEIAKMETKNAMVCVERIIEIEKELGNDTDISRLALTDMQSTTVH